MISIIICSTNPERLARVEGNISATVGCEHEFVVRDNKGKSDGICKVYNELAREAKGEYYCFVHEDVLFDTPDWGVKFREKAADSNVGIIGFAGAAMKTRTLSGMMHPHYTESNVANIKEGEQIPVSYRRYSVSGLEFGPVVTVDGVCMFMRRDVFEKVGGFDQQTFTGFHLYDLDISTAAVVAGFTNYTCHSVRFIHFSLGDYNIQWYEHSRIYHRKWDDVLPLYLNRPSEKQIEKDERYMFFNITYHLLKRTKLPTDELWQRVKMQWRKNPFYHKSYYHIYRYMRYCIEYRKTECNRTK